MTTIIAPRGLNGVVVAETAIGDVRGDEGFFHYRQYDATELARRRSYADVVALILDGLLPRPGDEAAAARLAAGRALPASVVPALRAVAAAPGDTATHLRASWPLVAAALGARPLLDTEPDERLRLSWALSAAAPTLAAALHRLATGAEPLDPDPSLDVATDYVRMVTGCTPDAAHARAIEQYLILTIDHGFNASTFTGRVIASTGADLGAVVAGALGALTGPLHGGAPSRTLEAIDAIGAPDAAEAWVRAEVTAGRRVMGFGHAVYRTIDPRSELLRSVAVALGGPVIERAIGVEGEVVSTLRSLKPDRPLYANVELYAAVVMEACGLPRSMFTPTFATSRLVSWCAHALEQAGDAKLIRPSARYVGPEPPVAVPFTA